MSVRQNRLIDFLGHSPEVRNVRLVRSALASNKGRRPQRFRIKRPQPAQVPGHTAFRLEWWDSKGLSIFEVVTSDMARLTHRLERKFRREA